MLGKNSDTSKKNLERANKKEASFSSSFSDGLSLDCPSSEGSDAIEQAKEASTAEIKRQFRLMLDTINCLSHSLKDLYSLSDIPKASSFHFTIETFIKTLGLPKDNPFIVSPVLTKVPQILIWREERIEEFKWLVSTILTEYFSQYKNTAELESAFAMSSSGVFILKGNVATKSEFKKHIETLARKADLAELAELFAANIKESNTSKMRQAANYLSNITALEELRVGNSERMVERIKGKPITSMIEEYAVFNEDFYKLHMHKFSEDIIMGYLPKEKMAERALHFSNLFIPLEERQYYPERIEHLWNDLYESFPNFAEVIDFIKQTLHRNFLLGKSVKIPPIIIHGMPGIGKTQFIRALENILPVPLRFYSATGFHGTFEILGGDSQWGSAKPGILIDVFADTEVKNPLLVIDEIDKAPASKNHGNIYNALLEILEPSSAGHVRNSFFNISIDCSSVNFIFMANDISAVPAPFISRCKTFHVRTPSKDEEEKIIQSIYQNVLEENELKEYLAPSLHSMCVRQLKDKRPREVYQMIDKAVAALLMSFNELPDDVLHLKLKHFEESVRSRLWI